MTESNTQIITEETPSNKKFTGKTKEKFITIIVNGKEKRISKQSQYILDMLTIDDE